MKNKIKTWKDQNDIEIQCTNDKIINITGMIGSGKSTYANQFRNNRKYIVISLDCLFRGQDKANLNDETIKIIEMLRNKFLEELYEENFKKYYIEIVNYINTLGKKDVTYVLEGQHIYRFLEKNDIKGTLFIKKTSLFHCWERSIKRHIKKEKVKFKNKQITKRQYLLTIWFWMKRRTKQLRYYKKLNQLLKSIK